MPTSDGVKTWIECRSPVRFDQRFSPTTWYLLLRWFSIPVFFLFFSFSVFIVLGRTGVVDTGGVSWTSNILRSTRLYVRTIRLVRM